MRVQKFGGTSVGSAERIKHVVSLVGQNPDGFVVCSAMSGVTNTLVAMAAAWSEGRRDDWERDVSSLRSKFATTCRELFSTTEAAQPSLEDVNTTFESIGKRMDGEYSETNEKWLLAQGEVITSKLIVSFMNFIGMPTIWLNAFDFMKTGRDGEPHVEEIRQLLLGYIDPEHRGYYLTQGFICLDYNDQPDNLKRGGSDYSATLIGAALRSDCIEIWTDIDGVRNNDPRYVENTFPIREMSFEEAAELAYFGAKILHPSCVWPASSNGIPILLKNTLAPSAPGTLIRSGTTSKGIRAVAAKDNITIIRIVSGRMLNAYGFLRSVFEIFEKYRTPIDVITTSEVAVSLTIDDPRWVKNIVDELNALGTVTVECDQAIVCVVGDVMAEHQGNAVRILEALRHYQVKMISYGGSHNNITLVVQGESKIDVLRELNILLFDNPLKPVDTCTTFQG